MPIGNKSLRRDGLWRPQFPKERKFLIENGAILSRPMQNLQIVPWKDLNRLGIIGQKRRRVPSIIPRHFPPGLTPVTVFIPLLQSQHIRLTKMNRKSVRHRHHGPVISAPIPAAPRRRPKRSPRRVTSGTAARSRPSRPVRRMASRRSNARTAAARKPKPRPSRNSDTLSGEQK